MDIARLYEDPSKPPEPIDDVLAAIKIITFAEEQHELSVVKRGLHNLISNPAYWDQLEIDPDVIANNLGWGPISRSYTTRIHLEREWLNYILVVPCTDEHGNTSCPARSGEDNPSVQCVADADRAARWYDFVLSRKAHTTGAPLDPLRYDWVREHEEILKEEWCEACLAERRASWEKKRVGWWKSMDFWLMGHQVEGAEQGRSGDGMAG